MLGGHAAKGRYVCVWVCQILFSFSSLLHCSLAPQLEAEINLVVPSCLQISRICASLCEAFLVFYSSTKQIQSIAVLMLYYFRFTSHFWTSVFHHLEIKNGESVPPLLFTFKSKIYAYRQWLCGPAIPCGRDRGEWCAAKTSAYRNLIKRLKIKEQRLNSIINLNQKMCVASNHQDMMGRNQVDSIRKWGREHFFFLIAAKKHACFSFCMKW